MRPIVARRLERGRQRLEAARRDGGIDDVLGAQGRVVFSVDLDYFFADHRK